MNHNSWNNIIGYFCKPDNVDNPSKYSTTGEM